MKRYAICPVIGSGAEDDPYRAKVPTSMNHVAVIPSHPDGTPRWPWALVEVAGADLSALDADAEVDAFPIVSAETLLSSLSKPVQNRIRDVLQRRGVGFTFVPDYTVVDLIAAIGAYLDAGQFSRIGTSVRDGG